MSDDVIGRVEYERGLHQLDSSLRNHYDGLFKTAMKTISDTEKAISDRSSRNMKWLITTVVAVLVGYAGVAVTLEVASKNSQVSAKEAQAATDAQQTQQILEAWKAIGSTAAVVEESSKNTTNHIERVDTEIGEVRKEVNDRIHELEKEQRQHERTKEH